MTESPTGVNSPAAQRPHVVAVLPGLYPSTIINLAKPLLALRDAGSIDLDLTFQFLARRQQVRRADVLVLCHSIDPQCGWMLDEARDAGIPMLYEMDDNLLEPPPDVKGMAYLTAPDRQETLKRCVRQAALVRTYAPALQRVLQPMNANVVLVPGPIDWSLVPDRAPDRAAGRVHLVYATGRHQDSIGAMLVAPLRRVLDAHEDVSLTVWGPRLDGLSGHPRVHHRARIADYDRFFSEFARAGFDIGLAPLPDDPFHRCKTNLKYREYAACRIAGIYSDTEVYRGSVGEGVSGLLVQPSESAWVEALERLTADPALRQRIQQEAQADARARYPQGQMERDWLTHLQQTARQNVSSAARGVDRPASGAAVTGRPTAGPLAVSLGIARQALRYMVRVPRVLITEGPGEVWKRTRGQVAGLWQVLAWELARRRMPGPRAHQ